MEISNKVNAPPVFPGVYVNFTFSKEEDFRVQVIEINPKKNKFKILQNEEEKDFLSLCQEKGDAILINSGYFTPERKSLGLLISEGRKISPLVKSKLLTGIFYITKSGKAKIEKVSSFSEQNVDFAIQGGPLIIEPGRKKGIYADNGKADFRTVIGVTNYNRVLIFTFYSKELTLYQVQEYLLKKFPKIQAALNLDGGGSTAACINSEKLKNFIPPLSILPNIIQISPKN